MVFWKGTGALVLVAGALEVSVEVELRTVDVGRTTEVECDVDDTVAFVLVVACEVVDELLGRVLVEVVRRLLVLDVRAVELVVVRIEELEVVRTEELEVVRTEELVVRAVEVDVG